MKFYIDDELFYEINETQLKILKHVLFEEVLQEVIKDKIKLILDKYIEGCGTKLKAEWMPRLKANGIKMIPTNDDELAQLIFSQSNYENRNQREKFIKEKHQAPR